MSVYHDEIEIEDFEYDEETETYYYPCPCGDKFEITKVPLFFVFFGEVSCQPAGRRLSGLLPASYWNTYKKCFLIAFLLPKA